MITVDYMERRTAGEERLEPVDGFGEEEGNKVCPADQCFAPGYHFYSVKYMDL